MLVNVLSIGGVLTGDKNKQGIPVFAGIRGYAPLYRQRAEISVVGLVSESDAFKDSGSETTQSTKLVFIYGFEK